jgi:hypothetical protein
LADPGCSDTDADLPGARRRSGGDVRGVDRGHAALRDDGGFRATGVRQKDRELLAAITRNDIGRACRAARQQLRHTPQAGVALLMPMMVVVALEVVDIDQQQAQRGAMAHYAHPLLAEPGVEASAVGDAGQGIGLRQRFHLRVGLGQPGVELGQLLLAPHQLGDLGAHPGDAAVASLPLVDAQPAVAGQLLDLWSRRRAMALQPFG